MSRISRLMIQKDVLKDRLPDINDPQKNRVYEMERSIAGWAVYAHVDYDDLQRIADYACRKFKVKRVGVTIVNLSRKRIFGWCEDTTIHLNADYHGDNTAVLLHELAHYITDQKYPDTEAHGPHFVQTYGELLDMFNCLPYYLFEELCLNYNVQIGEYNEDANRV